MGTRSSHAATATALAITTDIGPDQPHMTSWTVFRNCNVRPCHIGVAVSDWPPSGWSRIASFQNDAWAWKHACWLIMSIVAVNRPT